MDGEHCLKPVTEDEQIDMMMMLQMDKIPTEYFAAYNDNHAYHSSGYSSSMGHFNNNMSSQFYDTHQPRGTAGSSTLSFSNPNGHPTAPHFLSESGNGSSNKWRGDEDNPFTTPAQKRNSMAAMREMIFRIAAMQPGGTKMDTASMLDEAIHYVKFLKTQVQSLERAQGSNSTNISNGTIGFPVTMASNHHNQNNNGSYLTMGNVYQTAAVPQQYGDS